MKNVILRALGATIFSFVVVFFGPTLTVAATTPSLGVATTYGVLANIYTNPVPGTTVNGDVGFATAPAIVPAGTHVNYGSGAPYATAGTDKSSALADLNSQACTFTFAPGIIDLATDTTHGQMGVYTPGVYCVSSMTPAVSLGASGITLSGSGTYIFRFNGSLVTAASSVVTLSNGASACNVFWTPIDNAITSTLGANSIFAGTLIGTTRLAIRTNVTWVGRALLFNGTVVTDVDDTITVPSSCTLLQSPDLLRVIKTVINDNGGTAVASDFTIHVKSSGSMGVTDVTGSPAVGVSSPGREYWLLANTYVVSEDAHAGYTATFSGDCDASGNVVVGLAPKTCTIINNDSAPPPATSELATLHVIKHVVNNDGGKEIASDFIMHVKAPGSSGPLADSVSPAAGTEAPGSFHALTPGTYVVSEDAHAGYAQSFSGDCDGNGNVTLISGADKICTITNDDISVKTPPPPSTSESATLHVIKIVINDNGGKAVVSDAVIHVTSDSGDVAGSPQSGAVFPGTSYSLGAGTYTVSEDFFAGYKVTIGGDCSASGAIVLAWGDDKTCTITNNDIAGVQPPSTPPNPPTLNPPSTPPSSKPPCDICTRLTYDVYIINPDGSQRHTGTPWVKVTDRGKGIVRYSFEDATLDSRNPLFDHNDSVIDVDINDCKSVKFMFVSSDASWKHQIRIKVLIDGVAQVDTLVVNDSKAVVGISKTINAVADLNTSLACLVGQSSMNGKILLQVQAHGEAWYVRPESGLRYYMKDGSVAYTLMRNFGVGITDIYLKSIPSAKTVDELEKSTSACLSGSIASKMKGKILLQVQQHGEAWYVDSGKCRRIYLKDGEAAYTVMRFLGLGITDANLAKIKIGT